MKRLLTGIALLTLAASCGRVERPEQLFDFLNHDKKIEKLDDRVDGIEKRLDELYSGLGALSISINNLEVNQDTLEETVALQTTSIATLQSNTSVREMIDPCGNNEGEFDEILLVMTDGTIIAYFEQGSRRFLSQLPDGNFRTTDKQRCNFSIVNGIYKD